MIASAPHGPGPFPPALESRRRHGRPRRAEPAQLLARRARALPRARSLGRRGGQRRRRARIRDLADGTLTPPDRAGWPAVPGFALPQQPLRAFPSELRPGLVEGHRQRRAARRSASRSSVSVPAVDADGNVRAGIRLPDIAGAAGDAGGWNYRDRVDRRARSAGRRDRIAHPVRAARRADRDTHGRSAAVGREERVQRAASDYVGKCHCRDPRAGGASAIFRCPKTSPTCCSGRPNTGTGAVRSKRQ